jgi:predicted short-subunit dehydrogenase-like oxidoreductase (DUF2520 family)
MDGAAPLGGLRFSLVGAGRVGGSLAAWAVAAGAQLVASVGRAQVAGASSRGQDLLLIAVPDGALDQVAADLAGRPQAAVALHTSGSRDAGTLAPLAAHGTAIGALHPLKAFPFPLPDPAQAHGVFFGLDGDPAALRLARRLVAAWGGVADQVPPAARPLYHFAATLAAGGVATLLAAAADLAARAGLPPAVAAGYVELARGTVAAIATAGAAEAALTGPIARGDLATFARHLQAIRQASPERIPLAVEIARETLRARETAATKPAIKTTADNGGKGVLAGGRAGVAIGMGEIGAAEPRLPSTDYAALRSRLEELAAAAAAGVAGDANGASPQTRRGEI